MAPIKLEISESAIEDLQSIKQWYEEQLVPAVGQRLIVEVLERIESLIENPDLGRSVPEFDQPWLRELIKASPLAL